MMSIKDNPIENEMDYLNYFKNITQTISLLEELAGAYKHHLRHILSFSKEEQVAWLKDECENLTLDTDVSVANEIVRKLKDLIPLEDL